jgi:hypothetical protein
MLMLIALALACGPFPFAIYRDMIGRPLDDEQHKLCKLLMVFGAFIIYVLTATPAHAQIKQQLFVGAGATVPRNDGASSTSISGGYAVVVPLADGWSIRPVVSVARVNPTAAGKDPFASVLAGALIIRRITPTFTLLSGGGETVAFQPTGTTHTPVFLVSTGNKISNHFILLTPVSVTKNGLGFTTQLAVTW